MILSHLLSAWFGIQTVGGRRAGSRSLRRLEQLECRLNLSAVLVVETADSYWLIEEPNFGLPAATASDAVTDTSGLSDSLCGLDSTVIGSAGSDFLTDDESLASLLSAVSSDKVLTKFESQQMSDMLSELLAYGDFTTQDVWSISLVSNSTIDGLETSGYFDDGSSSSADSLFASDSFSSDSEDFNVSADNTSTTSDTGESNSSTNRSNSRSTNGLSNTVLTGAAGSDFIFVSRFEQFESESSEREWNSQTNSVTSSQMTADRATRLLPSELAELVLNDRMRETNATDAVAGEIEANGNFRQRQRVAQNGDVTTEATNLNVDRLFTRFQSDTLELTSLSRAVRYLKAVSGIANSDDSTSSDATGEDSGWSYAQMASLVGTISLTLASWHQRSERDHFGNAVPLKSRSPRKEPVAC